MKKTYLCVLVLAVFLTFGGTGDADAAYVTFEPLNPSVLQGQSFTINIVGNEFPATAGGDVEIYWNSSLLTLTGTSYTGSAFDVAGGSSSPGYAYLALGLDIGTPNPSGSFFIAALQFAASNSNTGSSLFTITPSYWLDASGNVFSTQPEGRGGTIAVNAVPIPGAVWLLGSGLLGLVAIRRRMKK